MSADRERIAVVGGGPAGLQLAILLSDSHEVVVYDRFAPGGELLSLGLVSAPSGARAEGPDLATELLEHAMDKGVLIEFDEVQALRADESGWTLVTDGGERSAARVVLATGGEHGQAPVPGAEALLGRGVSYCAGCDGPMYRGKTVAVVGDGPWAHSDAVTLAGHADRVVLFTQQAAPPESHVVIEPASPTELVLVNGDEVRGLLLDNGETVDVDGVFVSVPTRPRSELAEGHAEIDETGRVVVDQELQSKQGGLYAIGDVRAGSAGSVAGAFADATALARTLTTP